VSEGKSTHNALAVGSAKVVRPEKIMDAAKEIS
jgi:hypothetical protein